MFQNRNIPFRAIIEMVNYMQRYFIDDYIEKGKLVKITGSDVHHIKNVMRFKRGKKVAVCGVNACFLCEISSFVNEHVYLTVIEVLEDNELSVQIDIAQALIRRERFEYMLQKAVELGVHKIIPLVTTNNVVNLDRSKKTAKLKRWNTILKEACEQSRRSKLATVSDILELTKLPYSTYDKVIVAYEKKSGSNDLVDVINEKSEKILLVIGPEGGFTEKEIAFLQLIPNVYLVGLGKRILRSETASLFLLSILGYKYEMEASK